LSDDKQALLNRPYKIKVEEIDVAQAVAKKATVYQLRNESKPEIAIDINGNLASLLTVDIEYNGPTIKDRLLIWTPVAMSCILPELILKINDYASYKAVNTFFPVAASIFGGSLIGQYLFPLFDRHNSGVVLLKKFFGDANVRMNIRRDASFAFVTTMHYLCILVGSRFLAYQALPLKLIGCAVYYGLRFLISYRFAHYLHCKNPIDRGAPCTNPSLSQEKRDSIGYVYTLSDMKRS
jgi:hypothetical protein